MKQEFIYHLQDGFLKKVYGTAEELVKLSKLPGYYFSYSAALKEKNKSVIK